jgi:predicted metal-dependent hydrolase
VSLDSILPASSAQSGQLALWESRAAGPQVSVRHSRRARRIAVRIAAGGRVELVVPRGVPERHAWAFYESRVEWVREHLARRRVAAPTQEFPPRHLHLPLLEETWRLFRAGGAGRPRVVETGQVLELRGVGEPEAFRRCLLTWLKRRALAALAPRLAEEAGLHGFRYSRLRVGNQRSRWGSCSTRGLISLNLALLFQPEQVVRYLLCHELSHTRHMDHSARFWACVAQCMPRWRELDRQLAGGWRNVPSWIGGLA